MRLALLSTLFLGILALLPFIAANDPTFAVALAPANASSLARSLTTCTVIPQITAGSPATNYGPALLMIESYGINYYCCRMLFYCTASTGSSYSNNARQISSHSVSAATRLTYPRNSALHNPNLAQAPPGYRIELTLTAFHTEANYDFAGVYLATAASTVTTTASCSLTGSSDWALPLTSGSPALSTHYSSYGAQIGICFYSDNSEVYGGVRYTITLQACAAGQACATNAATGVACTGSTYSGAGFGACCPLGYTAHADVACTACPAGTYSFQLVSNSQSGCYPCPSDTYSSAGASDCTACPPGLTSPAGSMSASACVNPCTNIIPQITAGSPTSLFEWEISFCTTSAGNYYLNNALQSTRHAVSAHPPSTHTVRSSKNLAIARPYITPTLRRHRPVTVSSLP